jgi:hypothetical protein
MAGEDDPRRDFAARAEARDSAEMELLARLRDRGQALGDLLAQCSDHWGYEDPVYRFYHQSFKVYHVQQQTGSIVAALADLAPGRPLNAWFLDIVRMGTSKTFVMEDNSLAGHTSHPRSLLPRALLPRDGRALFATGIAAATPSERLRGLALPIRAPVAAMESAMKGCPKQRSALGPML